MNKITKTYLIIGPTVMSFIYAVTSPIIQIYFMKLVSIEILSISNAITIALAAIVNSTVPSTTMKNIYRRYFFKIVIVDIICFCIISVMSVEYVTVRFIGFAIINAISTNLWMIVLKDAINHVLSGSELTNWTAFSTSFELYASLLGCILATFIGLSIEVCILLQCAANILMGYSDLKAFCLLKNENKYETT